MRTPLSTSGSQSTIKYNSAMEEDSDDPADITASTNSFDSTFINMQGEDEN